ncbi:MAG: hypothetical protein KDI63_04200 [Gammaproteobacteria bacterium]|nr:hypothetical protein [Gammaproteobacteria bacterium]
MTAIVLLDKIGIHPGQPLWQRVPTRDKEGRSLTDFMMLIPKLGEWPEERREKVLEILQQVFSEFAERVVFADLNLRLNLLWISVRPGAEGCINLAMSIKARIPEAVLVASQAEAMAGFRHASRRRTVFWKQLGWPG